MFIKGNKHRGLLYVITTISKYVGGTGVSPTRILCSRPRDDGITITGDGDGLTEKVVLLFIRRLDFLFLGPSGPGPGENVGRTGVSPTRILIMRPRDGGIAILRDGDGNTEIVFHLVIRRQDLGLLAPIVPGPRENIGGTTIVNVKAFVCPHDGGVSITGHGDGYTKSVVYLFIRRLDLGSLGPTGPGPGENIGGTGVRKSVTARPRR